MTRSASRDIPSQLVELLSTRRFERIMVFSGAGMSEDSGIPTFRSGSNGLWSEFDPQELATPEAWRRDRELVWGWYEWRRGLVMAAQPHPGHLAVAQLQQRLGATVVTQNVDNLHERAGVAHVLHLHGSLFAARCAACGEPHTLTDPPPATTEQRLAPPRCSRCRGHVRPGVVWFGEGLDQDIVDEACKRIAACDLLLIVGTSGVVYPAAGLVGLAPGDALVIEINPQPGEIGAEVAFRWQATAAAALPGLVEVLGGA